MGNRLAGKVALISGGARGIGADEATLFASEGAKVVVADVLDMEGGRVAAGISDAGGNAFFVRLDVTMESDWLAAVDATVQRYEKLDIVSNNAGIYRTTLIEDTPEDEWDLVMETNAKSVFLGIKTAMPVLRRSGGGSIVNTSSTAGILGSFRGSAYGASKGAVRQLTKQAAIQGAADGIRVNSIHPGPIDTQMITANLATPESKANVLARVPLGRIGTVRDVAYAALYLASDESSYVTGAELLVDGGIAAR